MKTDHARCNACELSCSNCGAMQALAPMQVAYLVDVVRGFFLTHRRCEKPVEPSKQVELFDALAKSESDRCQERALRHYGTGIDGMSDSPDPETDPPGPMARHGEGLMLSPGGLHQLITATRPREFWPSLSDVESWHSDVRSDVQRWCRVELAHKHPIAGLSLPQRFPMPNVLQNVEFTKPKRGARPLSSPVQLRRQEHQDAKAQRPSPKRRRSGSTAETP